MLQNIEQTIHQIQTRQLYQALPVPAVTACILAVILAWFAVGDISTAFVGMWLALFLFVIAIRVVIWFRFQRIADQAVDVDIWFWRFRIGALALALCWALAVVVFFPDMSLVNQAMASVLIAGVIAGGISSLSYDLFVVRAYIVIVLFPLIVVMGFTDSGLNGISLLTIIFMLAMLLGASRLNEAFLGNIRMKEESIVSDRHIRESDRRVGLLFEQSPLAILEWNEGLRVIRWNPAIRRIFGFEDEDLSQFSLVRLFSNDDHDAFKRFCFDMLAVRDNCNERRFTCITKHGEERITNWFASVVRLENGEYGFAAQIEDVTDVERERASVQKRELHYEHLFNNVPVVIYTTAVSGEQEITYVSNNVREILGHRPQDFVGNNSMWLNSIHPDDREAVVTVRDHIFEHGGLTQEYRLKTGNGRYLWIRDELKLILDDAGLPSEVVGYWVNIDYDKQAQLVLERFKATLDMTMDSVFIFDAETLRFIYVNKGATKLVGYTESELKGMTPVFIQPLYDERQFRAVLEPLRERNGSLISLETFYRGRDERDIPVEIALQYVELPNEPGRYVAIVRDISERKKMDAMKDDFISTVSHELRTPLTSIHGALSLLRHSVEQGNCSKEEVSKFVEMAYNNSQRLKGLVNDIIDINKISLGVLEINLQSVQIMSVVKNALKENTGFASQYGVDFHMASSVRDDQTVIADPERLHQVLSNLLSNAAKFTGKGDSIVTNIELEGEKVKVSVSDHGRGISDDVKDLVFERFIQGDQSSTREYGGSGLGLSICKDLIERMHGRIGFYANERTAGTTFYITLPIKKGR